MRFVVAVFAVLTVAVAAGAQTAPAPGAGASAAAPAGVLPRTTTMKFNYENAPIDTVLDQMSQSFGFSIQKMTVLNGHISVSAPEPVTADEAIILLNSLLSPLGYAAIERPAQTTAAGITTRVLRVMSIDQAKKEAPVR